MSRDTEIERAAARANIWALTWRFFRRGKPYTGRIILTLAIILVASGAKTVQGALIKPVIDDLPTYEAIKDKPAAVLTMKDDTQRLGTIIEEREDVVVLEVLLKGSKGETVGAERMTYKKSDIATIKRMTAEVTRAKTHHDWFHKLLPRLDLKTVAILAISLSVIMFLTGYLRDYLTNFLTSRVVADLRNDVLEHLSYLPLKFFQSRKTERSKSEIVVIIRVYPVMTEPAPAHEFRRGNSGK